MRLATTRGVDAPTNLVISNVPGSAAPMYLAGARLEANYPVSAITDGMGLNITLLSYRDQLDFGIVVDREMVDDAWDLIKRLKAAHAELHALVSPPARASRNGRAPAKRRAAASHG
jgi:diacylglycerol O-acyltransferase / wax synthase